jgi:hypothetical protein
VVAFRPPPVIDRALRITQAIAVKAGLPAVAGLGAGGRALWRWRSELADAYAEGPAAIGTAVVPMGPPGFLAGFELYDVGSSTESRLASALLWIEPNGEWTEEERVVAARLANAATSSIAPPDPVRLREALSLASGPIRSRLALARGSRWAAPEANPIAHRVSLRLHQGIREAARRRDLETLAALERALAFVGRGHTAGESAELERLAGMPDGEFSRKVFRLPAPARRREAIEARLGGVLLFVPG